MTHATTELTPAQLGDLRRARDDIRSFAGAARVAAFNGWTLGFFAATSILFGLWSPTSLAMGFGLAIVARNEFVGGYRIRQLEPMGADLLWRNQLGLMVLVTVYCGLSMYRAVFYPNPELAQLTELLGTGTGDLVRSFTLSAYVAMIGATVIFQGLNARYYFLRASRLRDFVERTPGWVLEVQRSTV